MISSEPLVSIVIPVYNGAAFLRDALDSVLAQSWPRWECVVLDNASTDESPTILADYGSLDDRIRIFRNPAVLPMIANHNAALRLMSPASDYCKILHADDTMEPECLAQMVAVAELDPCIGLVGSRLRWGNREEGHGLPTVLNHFDGRTIGQMTLNGDIYPFWSPSCLLIRSSIVRERGDFYRSSALHTDVEACYEILDRHDFGFVHAVLTNIRTHDDSVTSREAKPLNRLIAANLELLVRFGPTFLDPGQLGARRRAHLQRYYRFLARGLLEGRDAAFWAFHRESLARCGMPLQSWRLGAAVIGEIVRNPRRSLRRLIRGRMGGARVKIA